MGDEGLQNGMQVVVQRKDSDGTVSCRGYAGLPGTSPALILIWAGPAPAAQLLGRRLTDAINQAILNLTHSTSEALPPCNGSVQNELECHVHKIDACRKLLVIITDSSTPVMDDPLFGKWMTGGEQYLVLPLLPKGSDPLGLLPHELHHLNVAWWENAPQDCLDEILGIAGIGTQDRRVFISYRRNESLEIAEQLFEELPKFGFDVFVDRFRVPPGIDFQERLTDELSDKAMVLVLESPSILLSQWTEYELAFAKKHDLGHLAIHLPGGVSVPWLDDEYRVEFDITDLDPPAALSASSRLTPEALSKLTQRLIEEHTRSYIRRREFLLESIRAALTRHGATDQLLDPRGHLVVEVGPITKRKRYLVWASPRPPRTSDFHEAHRASAFGIGPSRAMVTTTVYREVRRHREANWLAEVSMIRLADEGQISDLAQAIADGKDLS